MPDQVPASTSEAPFYKHMQQKLPEFQKTREKFKIALEQASGTLAEHHGLLASGSLQQQLDSCEALHKKFVGAVTNFAFLNTLRNPTTRAMNGKELRRMLHNLWSANRENPEVTRSILDETEGVLKAHGFIPDHSEASAVKATLASDASVDKPVPKGKQRKIANLSDGPHPSHEAVSDANRLCRQQRK